MHDALSAVPSDKRPQRRLDLPNARNELEAWRALFTSKTCKGDHLPKLGVGNPLLDSEPYNAEAKRAEAAVVRRPRVKVCVYKSRCAGRPPFERTRERHPARRRRHRDATEGPLRSDRLADDPKALERDDGFLTAT